MHFHYVRSIAIEEWQRSPFFVPVITPEEALEKGQAKAEKEYGSHIGKAELSDVRLFDEIDGYRVVLEKIED